MNQKRLTHSERAERKERCKNEEENELALKLEVDHGIKKTSTYEKANDGDPTKRRGQQRFRN